MRGKVLFLFQRFHFFRITPAYAGKSKSINCERNRSKDHPRLCGEKAFHKKSANLPIGSPPPMRGKGIDEVYNVIGYKDHPRLCGEK